jgi:hypothetical protein
LKSKGKKQKKIATIYAIQKTSIGQTTKALSNSRPGVEFNRDLVLIPKI